MIKHLIQFTGACEPDWNWACAILWINILWKAHLSVLSLKATDQTHEGGLVWCFDPGKWLEWNFSEILVLNCFLRLRINKNYGLLRLLKIRYQSLMGFLNDKLQCSIEVSLAAIPKEPQRNRENEDNTWKNNHRSWVWRFCGIANWKLNNQYVVVPLWSVGSPLVVQPYNILCIKPVSYVIVWTDLISIRAQSGMGAICV